jgi:hypothetical protein
MTAKIKLNAASGGGSFSLQAPSSSSNNRVFTIPDVADGTIATTATAGKILQVVNSQSTSTGSIHLNPTKTLINIPNQSVSITPTSSSSKILISFQQYGESGTSSHQQNIVLKRAISGGATTEIKGDTGSNANQTAVFTQLAVAYHADDNNSTPEVGHCSNYYDSPNTTSAVTYTLAMQDGESTSYYYYNRCVNDANSNFVERGISWITVMEVSA